MKQEYSFEQVYDAAQRGFDALYTIVRHDVRGAWKKMNRAERYNAARGLVALRDVASAPDKYLSRAMTEDAWIDRAKKFAKEHDLPDIKSAYYIIQDPVGMSMRDFQNVLGFYYGDNKKLCGGYWNWQGYHNLADAFMRYDYERTSDSPVVTQNKAAKVIGVSERICDRAAEVQANGIKREFLKLIHKCKSYNK